MTVDIDTISTLNSSCLTFKQELILSAPKEIPDWFKPKIPYQYITKKFLYEFLYDLSNQTLNKTPIHKYLNFAMIVKYILEDIHSYKELDEYLNNNMQYYLGIQLEQEQDIKAFHYLLITKLKFIYYNIDKVSNNADIFLIKLQNLYVKEIQYIKKMKLVYWPIYYANSIIENQNIQIKLSWDE